MTLVSVPDDVRRRLQPGEMVRWIGAPDPSKLFGRADLYLDAVGRFAVKAIVRRRTTYVVTDRRMPSLRGGNVRAVPLVGQPTSIQETTSHVTVTIGTLPRIPGVPRIPMDIEGTGWLMYFTVPGSVTFYDVEDVEGLLRALQPAS